jgi:hypothetical protein
MIDFTKVKLNYVQRVLTKPQQDRLYANGKNRDQDHAPVVKFFNPRGAATWLISELDPNGIAFGLCDLGMGFPELGCVSLEELADIGFIERDLHFKGEHPMSHYADDASNKGRIVA